MNEPIFIDDEMRGILSRIRGIMDEAAANETDEPVVRRACGDHGTGRDLHAELSAARRRAKAVESVLLTKITQEFDGDPRRMAREIMELRISEAAGR